MLAPNWIGVPPPIPGYRPPRRATSSVYCEANPIRAAGRQPEKRMRQTKIPRSRERGPFAGSIAIVLSLLPFPALAIRLLPFALLTKSPSDVEWQPQHRLAARSVRAVGERQGAAMRFGDLS